ncbi:MAG TPA: SPFH domain-containing protein [Candidatus Saccharimonadales bacterium]|nr:SPFH domain-containing protein [Candidatus Saccharimonadales bacterium]
MIDWLRERSGPTKGFFVLLALIGSVGFVGVLDSYTSTESGQIAVVRNGGPFDDRKPFMTIGSGSNIKWTGWWSKVRYYPSSPQPIDFVGAYKTDEPGVNYNAFPTRDGIDVGIKGQMLITITGDAEKLKEFDASYGSRKYRGADGEFYFPSDSYDELKGWRAFLDAVLIKASDAAIRDEIVKYDCTALNPKCKLVKPQTTTEVKPGQTPVEVINPDAMTPEATSNREKIQTAVQKRLEEELAKLGGWVGEIKVVFNSVELVISDKVQTSIDKTLAAWADANAAQAAKAKAVLDADANEARQRGYNTCPSCAQIDALNALPDGLLSLGGAGLGITIPDPKAPAK